MTPEQAAEAGHLVAQVNKIDQQITEAAKSDVVLIGMSAAVATIGATACVLERRYAVGAMEHLRASLCARLRDLGVAI